MEKRIRLIRVHATQLEALRSYVEALYRHDDDYDSMVNIEEGLKSLMRNESLAAAYFITRTEERIGYVILTNYHSVEKGGLTIYIDELYVEARCRRTGIGRMIMVEIFQLAKDQGARALWAQTEPYNDAAQKFFLSQGFRVNDYQNFERPL